MIDWSTWNGTLAGYWWLKEREKMVSNRDWTYSEGCGCQVTFFAASHYHTSRVLPGENCTDHTGLHQVAERDCLRERAKEELDHYLRSRGEEPQP